MKNVKLPSGLMKVERTEDEKHRAFSPSGEFVERIKDRICREVTDVLVKGGIVVTVGKRVKRR